MWVEFVDDAGDTLFVQDMSCPPRVGEHVTYLFTAPLGEEPDEDTAQELMALHGSSWVTVSVCHRVTDAGTALDDHEIIVALQRIDVDRS